MRKINSINLSVQGFVLTLLLIVSSCSQESKMSRLLEYIPEESDVVLVGNIKMVIESAGGSIEDSKIKLPGFVLDNIPSRDLDSFDDFNFFLRKSGIDVETCAIIADYQHSYPIYLFLLNDENAFIKAIKDNGYKEKDNKEDIVFYSKKVYESTSGDYDDFAHIAVKGKCAYWIEKVWVGSSFNPQKKLERTITDASTASISNLKCTDYINEGNVFGAIFNIPSELRKELKKAGIPSSLLDQCEGSICVKGDLTNDKISLKAKWFGENGEEKRISDFGLMPNSNVAISSEALSYLGANESIIFAASVKDVDWDEYFETFINAAGLSRSDRTAVAVVKSYMEKIDGTIAFGLGLTNGLESIFNIILGHKTMEQISFTAIVETKEGKTKNLLNDIAALLEKTKIPFDNKSNGISINFFMNTLSGVVNVEMHDNLIIISNSSISRNNDNYVLKNIDYDKHMGGIAFALDRNNKLMKDFSVDYGIIASLMITPDPYEIELCIKINDTNTNNGIISKIANTIVSIIENEDELDNRWREYRTRHYSSIEPDVDKNVDTVAVDSVAVD